MYERSAIVLERYIDQLFGFNKEHNLRNNFLNFGNLIEELKEYQAMLCEEENVIGKFDEIAQEIQTIQKLQEKLCLSNQKLENERNKLFNEIEGNPNTVQNRLEKLENIVDENNEELKKLREQYIKAFVIFIERQKERNKFARKKRTIEANHLAKMKEINKRFQGLDTKYVQVMKRFLENDKGKIKDEITDIMIKNGRNEKIGFNRQVIDNAVDIRTYISEREAECYIKVYEKIKKLLSEVENDNLKLDNYERLFRDTSVKLAFLNAEKEYIVEFLDNERMTVIGGIQVHEKMMDEACRNFETDIRQIDNLYELILREITGKSEKSAYEELYNKTYLRDIQEEEKSFEAEVTNIKINMGTVINSNYWRIEGIKHVYDVFQKEVTEKFGKDLSEYQVEEIEDLQQKMDEKMNVLKSIQNTIQEQVRSTINANNNIQPKLHSQYIYEEGDQYDDDYEEDEYEDNEDDNETNNNKNNTFNINQQYENITLFSEDEYKNTKYNDKKDEYENNKYYQNEENYETYQYNNDYNKENQDYQNITLFDEDNNKYEDTQEDEEEQFYDNNEEDYEDNQYYDDNEESEYEEEQYYDNDEDEYEEEQYYDNDENEEEQYYDDDEEEYEDNQYFEDYEEDNYEENEYYDDNEEDEYEQYNEYDDELDEENRYEKYKNKYLNDGLTYTNSYNNQSNHLFSRKQADDDEEEEDIYSVMFSKINNTRVKKRKTPSNRIKRNIAASMKEKNKKARRKQKDIYSFQGSNNVFDKIFKKR